MHCQWHQWFDNGLTFKTNGLYNCKGYTYYPTNKIHCFNHPQAMSVGKVFAQYMAGGILDRLILHHMKSTLICVFIDICAYRKQYIYIYPQTGTFADPETHPLRGFGPFCRGRVLAFGFFLLDKVPRNGLLRYILYTCPNM